MAEGAAPPEGKVVINDGVGVLRRGDAVLIVYQKAARLHRTSWLFDVMDAVVATTDEGVMGFMVVLPSADPPDAPTRRENTLRLRQLGGRVSRLVTIPVGDAFRISVVRAVMRGLNVVLGHSGTRFVSDTVEAGAACLLEAKGPKTPAAPQIFADIAAIYAALGEPVPKFGSAA